MRRDASRGSPEDSDKQRERRPVGVAPRLREGLFSICTEKAAQIDRDLAKQTGAGGRNPSAQEAFQGRQRLQLPRLPIPRHLQEWQLLANSPHGQPKEEVPRYTSNGGVGSPILR